MGDGFQVHVFDDPEVEMRLESGGCMCYNLVKTMVFEGFHFFIDSLIWCLEGWFQVSFWCLLVALGTLFMIFDGIGSRLEF